MGSKLEIAGPKKAGGNACQTAHNHLTNCAQMGHNRSTTGSNKSGLWEILGLRKLHRAIIRVGLIVAPATGGVVNWVQLP